MNYYCTLFDSKYLTRGLTMYQSLVRSGEAFGLVIYCFDNVCHETLQKMKLEHVTLVPLAEFETAELKNVKARRTTAEYCWTCTPQVISHSLEKLGLKQVTYVDADLYFFSGPSVLLDELDRSDGSVLITEHRYTPRYDQSAASGIYCVQFISFKADARGFETLNWWSARCLEWCHARFEDGKYGDQKYLDDWTSRFEGVHVLQHLGGGVAPWNVQQYQVGPGPSVDGLPVVFYHFHYVIWYRDDTFDLGGYELSEQVINRLYDPYLVQLKESLERVRSVSADFSGGVLSKRYDVITLARLARRRLLGEYNVIKR
jgi:hypothetical protein